MLLMIAIKPITYMSSVALPYPWQTGTVASVAGQDEDEALPIVACPLFILTEIVLKIWTKSILVEDA